MQKSSSSSSSSSSTATQPPVVPLVLVPTILSVDAPYTRAAGVRETGKVRCEYSRAQVTLFPVEPKGSLLLFFFFFLFFLFAQMMPLFFSHCVYNFPVFSFANADVGNARPFLEASGGGLLVDFDLLSSAPPALNRAGAGDILSIFTALRDWQNAASRQGEPYDEDVA